MILKVKSQVQIPAEQIRHMELEEMGDGEVAVKVVSGAGTADEDYTYLVTFKPDGTFYRDIHVDANFGFKLEANGKIVEVGQ